MEKKLIKLLFLSFGSLFLILKYLYYKINNKLNNKILFQINQKNEKKKVKIKIPATVANLGSGFDCVGMAIDLWNEVIIERSNKFEIIYINSDCSSTNSLNNELDIPLDQNNLVCIGVKTAFIAVNKSLPILKYTLTCNIPTSRGLGSSSTAIVGGIVAGLVLAGVDIGTLDYELVLNLAASLEGHPDNVAPAIYGGIRIGISISEDNNKRWISSPVNVPNGLCCICYITKIEGKTNTARHLLNETITLEDAKFNIGRVAWLINCLNNSDLNRLCYGTEDRLHQPQRGKLIYSHLNPMINEITKLGAYGVFLSGAGPSIMALTKNDDENRIHKIMSTMESIGKKYGWNGDIICTVPTLQGIIINIEQ